jgi:hypothetical protein
MTTIRKWMRQPVSIVCHPGNSYMNVSKLLLVEARFYRKCGNKAGAKALESAAEALRQVSGDAIAPDVAFGWPEEKP